jgi:flavin reductase (DIM6/NTAB) family NADH-FMN oxidoreductase RutF
MFPMDLLGDIESSGRYVFGLRHSNVTLEKIITTGKLVVSEVASEYKDIIYQLGKHHSSSPPPLRSLPFELVKTENFGFYVPAWTECYKEIKILNTIDLGSHMLLWGKVENTQFLNPCQDHLFLIHFFQYMRLKQEHSDYSLA